MDTHVYEGYEVPSRPGSVLAKAVVWDEGRRRTVAQMARALSEFELQGVPTTRELAIEIMHSEDFRTGEYTTAYLREPAGRLAQLAP